MYLTFMKLILMILKITWSIFKIILLVDFHHSKVNILSLANESIIMDTTISGSMNVFNDKEVSMLLVADVYICQSQTDTYIHSFL
jgi:hypothetical protein